MKLAVALRLGRVSNLPTVTSNVLAAIALAGGHPAPLRVVIVGLAMTMMSVAGGHLIDDAGQTRRSALGFGLIAAAIALIAAFALVTDAGWWPIASAAVLGGLMVAYRGIPQRNPLSPLVVGLCRAGVYTTAALCVRPELCAEVVIGAATLTAYVIGLAHIARSIEPHRPPAEPEHDLGSTWPLGFLAVPFLVVIPQGAFAIALYAGFLIWVLRALTLVTGRQIRGAVTSLIAGISLLDALWLAREGRPAWALVAVIAFFGTTILQRRVADG